MKIRNTKLFKTIILVMVSVFMCTQAFAGAYGYTYYPSGRIQTLTLEFPDQFGNVYYHYTDENWTYVSGEGKWQGKMDVRVLYEPDHHDVMLYKYVFPLSYSLFEFSSGFYKYENTAFTKISASIPNKVVNADLNGDSILDLLLGYDGVGFYKYVNSGLTRISTSVPTQVIVADLDGNGADDVVLDYGASGLYKYTNNSTLAKISSSDAGTITLADLNGDGKDDLLVDFGGGGFYKYVNSAWKQISSSVPTQVIVADLDGNGADDVVLDYGASGLYKYTNNSTLAKISSSDAGTITLADLNGDGKDDLLVDFGAAGFYKYVNSAWTKISSSIPSEVKVQDLNGNLKDDLILDYGASGAYKYTNNSTLTKISSSEPEDISSADVHAIRTVIYGYDDVEYTNLMSQKVSEIQTTELQTGGGAHKDTSQVKFGETSAYFENDVTDDYIGVPSSYKWIFGVGGEWTVDGWVRLESLYEDNVIMCNEDYAVDIIENGIVFVMDPFGEEPITNIFAFTDETTIGTDQWYHIALVSDGSTLNAYVDGVCLLGGDGPMDISAVDVDLGSFAIGGTAGAAPDVDMNGWMDDLRITEYARWDGDFTPPETQAEIEEGTVFLLSANGSNGATNFSSTTMDEIQTRVWDEYGNLIEDFDIDKDYYTTYEYVYDDILEKWRCTYKETTTISTGSRRGDWYFDDEVNYLYLWKFCDESDNTAGIYFPAPGDKLETYWKEDGSISHWASVSELDAGRTRWDINATQTDLDIYGYYTESGNGEYKETYVDIGGVWTWSIENRYNDAPDWSSWAGSETVYADRWNTEDPDITETYNNIPDKPVIEESEPMSLGLPETSRSLTSDDKLIGEDLKESFEKVNSMKVGSSGEGVLVALLDSGVDTLRDDLNVIGGYDFAGSSRHDGIGDEDYSDSMGHGTKTAEVLAGTASGAEILAVKVMDNYNRTTSEIVAEAIRYAVNVGARVLAMPFNLLPVSSLVTDAIAYAVDKGAILIAAAGNDGTDIKDSSLAAQEGVITVGSVDNDGKLSTWSNTGEEVDLYTPWDILGNEQGTSFSAAYVAGIAALMFEDAPDMTADELLAGLKSIFGGIEGGSLIDPKVEAEVLAKNNAVLRNHQEFTGYGPEIEQKYFKEAAK